MDNGALIATRVKLSGDWTANEILARITYQETRSVKKGDM